MGKEIPRVGHEGTFWTPAQPRAGASHPEEGEASGQPKPQVPSSGSKFTGLGEIPAILRICEIEHPFPLLSCKKHSGLFSLCICVPREVTDSRVIGAESLSLSVERVRTPDEAPAPAFLNPLSYHF